MKSTLLCCVSSFQGILNPDLPDELIRYTPPDETKDSNNDCIGKKSSSKERSRIRINFYKLVLDVNILVVISHSTACYWGPEIVKVVAFLNRPKAVRLTFELAIDRHLAAGAWACWWEHRVLAARDPCFWRQICIRSETAVHIHSHIFSLSSHSRACLGSE